MVVASAVFCVALAAGAKLLAFPISQLCGLVPYVVWFAVVRRPLLADLWQARAEAAPLDWRRDVLPFQWRIAVTALTVSCGSSTKPASSPRAICTPR